MIGRKTHSAVPSSVCVAVNTFFIAVEEEGRQRFEIASNIHPTNSEKQKEKKKQGLFHKYFCIYQYGAESTKCLNGRKSMRELRRH
jgi:hypothetical protein